MAHSEKRIRAALRDIPDGTYSGEDFVDDDGISEAAIRICVNVRKKGDGATVDFTGSSPQVVGNLNCPIATAHAAVYYALIAVLDPHVPPNSGCYRPFKVVAEPGLVMNPRPPAAVQARTNTSQKISEATLRALALALPHRVTAGSHGNIMTNAFAGWYAGTHKRFVCIDIQGGGAGARPTKDGCDGQDSHLARFMNTPTEAQELEYPLRVERYEFIPDTGGAGKYRGALALRRDIRVLSDMSFSRYADRQKFPPFGVLGGMNGACGETRINGKKAKAKGIDRLKAGDVVSLLTPGAGGYGKPSERDPEAVRRDVRDGKVTREAAKRDYGVDA